MQDFLSEDVDAYICPFCLDFASESNPFSNRKTVDFNETTKIERG